MSTDLQGITLIDLAGMGPSARCVRVLADLGARWIRLRPPASAGRVTGDWHGYGALRGAEQFEFDLKHPLARELYLRLVKSADIVVEGFRPGVADRLGIGYRDLSVVNKRLVYCAATGYGQDGPLAQQVGHDINYQALGGALAPGGRTEEGTPAMPGFTAADSAGGGWHAAMRVLAALVERARTGRGKFLDISAAEGVLHLMAVDIDQELATGQAAAGSVLHGHYACYNLYATADGKSVAVGAIEPKFFANLCHELGLGAMAALQYREEAQPELRAALTAVFRTRTRDDWVARFSNTEACLSPVLAISELAGHPQWQARGMFVDYVHPQAGAARQIGPLGGGDSRGSAPDATKSVARDVLLSFGLAPEEIETLQINGVVR